MKKKRKGSKWMRKLSTRLILFAVALTAMICGAMMYANGSERKYGDVNTDEKVDVSDAVMLARYCAADREVRITLDGLNNADVNLDGFVSSEDLTTLLQQIAHLIPMTADPKAADPPIETTTTAETVTETTTTQETTTVTTTETTTTTEETTTTAADFMTADTETLPIGVSLSRLTGQQQPDEQLTVNYQVGNIIFSIYAQQPEKTMIGITYQDMIVGYYRFCKSYTVPDGYNVKEYYDTQSGVDNDLYAVLVLQDGMSIDFAKVVNPSEINVLSKLNYYATNGVRALYHVRALIWDDQVARVALAHSQEMADLDYFGHESYDGKKIGQRLLDAGIDWQSVGENVDYGFPEPFSAMDSWFNSTKGHRETLLAGKFARVGVGFASGEIHPGRFYGTQDYWRDWGE